MFTTPGKYRTTVLTPMSYHGFQYDAKAIIINDLTC